MGLFVHEYFSSGAFPGELRDSSLAREGLAMLAAIVEDFAGCFGSDTGRRPATTLDRRLFEEADRAGLTHWADVHWAESTEHEQFLFQKLAAGCEGTFVIAPESGGILLERRMLVDRAGGRFLGHSDEAIRLCSDKLTFYEHLTRYELPTIRTQLFDPSAAESTFQFPVVVKPRDGAGSEDTYLIRDGRHFHRLREHLRTTFGQRGRQAIVQPFVAGRSLSIAAIADSQTGCVHVFPAGQQHLSDDDRFQYRGGRIPAALPQSVDAVGLARRVCRLIPGLRGYIGFDLILTDDSPRIVFVEANPRLTTSYLGYRRLAKENLAARILEPGGTAPPIAWSAGAVEFTPDVLPA